jgi:hypothetical protein
MFLDIILVAKIVKVRLLICRNMSKGLGGLFLIPVGLGIHAVGLAVKVD